MYLIRLIAVIVAVAGVAGCVSGEKFQLTAAPLAEISEIPRVPDPVTPAKTIALPPIDEVHWLVQDSQQKCARFVTALLATTAGTDVALDFMSTATSAVAAVVTPLGVSHALSATSTILGATKSSLSAEYMNKLSISNITQAIQSTYSANMSKYVVSLNSLPDPQKVDVYAERSTILANHNLCSLAAAEGSVQASVSPSQTPNGNATHALMALPVAPQRPAPPVLGARIE